MLLLCYEIAQKIWFGFLIKWPVFFHNFDSMALPAKIFQFLNDWVKFILIIQFHSIKMCKVLHIGWFWISNQIKAAIFIRTAHTTFVITLFAYCMIHSKCLMEFLTLETTINDMSNQRIHLNLSVQLWVRPATTRKLLDHSTYKVRIYQN